MKQIIIFGLIVLMASIIYGEAQYTQEQIDNTDFDNYNLQIQHIGYYKKFYRHQPEEVIQVIEHNFLKKVPGGYNVSRVQNVINLLPYSDYVYCNTIRSTIECNTFVKLYADIQHQYTKEKIIKRLNRLKTVEDEDTLSIS